MKIGLSSFTTTIATLGSSGIVSIVRRIYESSSEANSFSEIWLCACTHAIKGLRTRLRIVKMIILFMALPDRLISRRTDKIYGTPVKILNKTSTRGIRRRKAEGGRRKAEGGVARRPRTLQE